MNSASMATNLLGRSVRLTKPPEGCRTDSGTIALVSIDDRGVHFLVLVDGRLVLITDCADLVIVD